MFVKKRMVFYRFIFILILMNIVWVCSFVINCLGIKFIFGYLRKVIIVFFFLLFCLIFKINFLVFICLVRMKIKFIKIKM